MDDNNILGCQVCLLKFQRVCSCKKHMRSQEHTKKMKEVFLTDTFKDVGYFPFINVIDPRVRSEMKQPIVGLSLLTLCFNPDTKAYFYLCHACAEKCPPDRIASHLSSGDHCCNYFNYTDPNALKFAWIPSINMRQILKNELQKEETDKGQGLLQMLHLPKTMFGKLQTSTYSEVMQTLCENDKLLKLLKAIQPKRAMMQMYHRDKNRKHPLLGLQHIVECICVGPAEKRYYLCTLCNLTLASHMIIRHVLSFDHIFCYFKAWHPSTLMSKECYTDNNHAFVTTISDLSKQAEKIHNPVNTDLKQVSLEPAQFASVNFTSYAKALKELESITKESLITTVTPGNKLEVSAVSWYKVCCQNCSVTFNNIFPYFKHAAKCTHKKMLKKCFDKVKGAQCYDDQTECRPFLGLFQYIKESCKEQEPVIGISLVVTCISFEVHVEPVYICFACEDCFSEFSLRQHFNSQKHLIQTLLYLNPWRLPFAWENQLDMTALKSMACEEEKERGPGLKMMKVLDIPYWIFQSLISTSFTNVMKRLELQHTILRREVPRRETNSKLQQNERFPLLGRNFLVMSGVRNPVECCLCLLCEERLSEDQVYAHVFSRKHVATFLERFHPGSLNSGTNPETLLDLAKQAARIHRVFDVQVITLEKPIWEPCSYHRAKTILTSAKRREGKGNLEPLIKPAMKLVPRGSLKDMDKDHVRDNSQKNSKMMESGGKTSQTSTVSETTLKKITEEAGAVTTATHCVKSEDAEKGADKETPTLSEKESERSIEVFSETISELMKNAGSVTSQVIMEKKAEEPIARKPRRETRESCQNTDTGDGTDGKEQSNNSQDVLKQLKNNTYNENERKRSHGSMSEKSQEDICPNEHVETEMVHKRLRLTIQEGSCEEPQNKGEDGKPVHKTAKASPNGNHQQAHDLWQYVKMESRDPVIGLSALLECHCGQHDPVYLCECCSQKIPEKDIVSHVTGFCHQTIYLGMLHKLPTLPEKDQDHREQIKLLAASFEKDNGYGEAQVTDLDEEMYNNILKQDFKSAIQTIKAFQVQQFRCEPTSTSPLSAVRALDASVNLHAQHDSHDSATDFQVVEMEIDNDSDCEVQSSSSTASLPVMTETTSEAPPESHEDVKVTQIKVSESADKASTCLSRASEDTADLHRFTKGTDTTHLHFDSTGNNSKTEISPDTALGSSKIEVSSKMFGTSQTATSSYSVTTQTKSMRVICQHTAKSSVSTQDTISVTGNTSGSTISNMTPTTKSEKLSKPTESRAGTASMQVAVASYKAATTSNTESTVVSEATSRIVPSSKMKNITKTSKTAASQTVVTSGASAKMTKMSVNRENTKASAKTVQLKNSVGPSDILPNIPKHNSPALPHLTTLKSGRSENENPPTDPSHISASHTHASKETPSESLCKIGINQLIAAMCRGKRQVYCKLCSTRLRSSSHTTDPDHQYKYLKMKYPEWTAKPHEYDSKFKRTVAHLAKVEKDLKFQTISQGIEVKNDVYHELAALPERKAIERLKAMMTQRDSQVSSSSMADTTENGRQLSEVAFASPCEVSSPDGAGMYMPQSETEGQQQKRGDPDAQQTSFEKSIKTDLLSAASLNTEQQSKSEASQKAQHGPKHPGCSPGPQALPRISLGEKTLGSSHLSTYLKVKGQHTEPVIGLGFVWECRGVSVTLFLCESCQEKLYISDICQHMVSVEHRVKYILKHHPQFLSFIEKQNLPQKMKLELLMEVAWLLAERELFNKIDAQVVLLRPGLYEHVQMAPFSEALKIVQNIKRGEKLSVSYLPVSSRPQKHQQPEDWQRLEESPITERPSAQALETDQRSDHGARQQLKKQDLGETEVVQDLDGVRQRKVLNPLNITGVSSKDDPDPFPGPGPLLGSQETSELRPLASQQQRLSPEVSLESPFSSIVGPKASQIPAVFPGDPTRKRPAVTPDSMLVRPFTNDVQLEEPLPAKYKPNPESVPESVPVYPTAASTLLSPKDTEPESDEKEPLMVNKANFSHLLALLKAKKSEMKSSSKSHLDGVGNSSDGVLLADPMCHENQLITPSANNSAHKSSLTSLSTETEAKADNTMFPSASTADPSDPQRQKSVSRQTEFGNVNLLEPSPFPYVNTKHNPDQVTQPGSNTEADGIGVCQLPINLVITARPDSHIQQFMRGYNDQDDRTVENRSNQVTQSFSRVGTVNPSDTLADTGGRGHSGYLSPGPVAGYTTPSHPFAYIQGHPNQIGLGQEANHVGQSLATPTPQDWVRLIQQQQLMQQLTLQQQYFPWTSASLAAGLGHVTNEALYFGSVPFTSPANNLQSGINLNDYRYSDITQSTPQVYINPVVAHCPPTAQSGVISQESAHRCFASDIQLFTEARSESSATPASRDATS